MQLDATDLEWANGMLADLADHFAGGLDEESDEEVATAMAQAFVDELEYRAAHGEERALRVIREHVAEGLATIIQTILDEHDPGDDNVALDPDELWALFQEVERRFDDASPPAVLVPGS